MDNENDKEKEKEKEKEKHKDKDKDEVESSSCLLNRIKGNLCFIIFKYLDLFTLTECLFVNKSFNTMIKKKYDKSTYLIKTSLKTYKANIRINYPTDLAYYLKNSAYQIRKNIKSIIKAQVTEYSPRVHILQYFFANIPFRPVTHINLKEGDLSKKSFKYLSFFLSHNNSTDIDLVVSDNKITHATLEPIVLHSQIKTLKMNRAQVDKHTMKMISKMKCKELIIQDADLDCNLLANLKTKNLQYLNVANNTIESQGVLNICSHLPSLIKLNLSKNNLNDIAIVYLGLYLKEHKCSLKSLNISHNKISTTGLIGLLSVINKRKTSIKRINISSNVIDSIPLRIMNFTSSSLEGLSIGDHNFTIDDLSILIDFSNKTQSLKLLDLNKIVLDNVYLHMIFKKLSGNQHLKHLKLTNSYLGSTEFSDIIGTYYDNQHSIHCLTLNYTFLMPKLFNKIILSNSLTYLNLEGNELNAWGSFLDDFFTAIIDNKTIIKLNLNNNLLQDKANQFLMKLSDANCACTLEELLLSYNSISQMNIELINLLLNNHALKTLDLSHNDIADELNNNYFLHSLALSSMNLLNIKHNHISLSFISKAIGYFNENKVRMHIVINIRSKRLIEEYENEDNKRLYSQLVDYPNIISL